MAAVEARDGYKNLIQRRFWRKKEREADNMLEAGIKGRQEVMVTDENSAAAVGSGLLPVFATPAMVALMEKTAWMSVAPYLNDGEGTVGTKLEIARFAVSAARTARFQRQRPAVPVREERRQASILPFCHY